MTITVDGPVASDSYVDALSQYYGLPADFEGTAFNSYELVSGGVEVDVWYNAGGGSYAGAHPVASATDFAGSGRIIIETLWASNGHINTTLPGVAPKLLSVKTSTLSTQSAYTIRLGGVKHDTSTPNGHIDVRSICVLFK
jgi:hypothetical protein